MLTEIMQLQNNLQRRLGIDFSSMSDEQRAQFMRDHFVYLDQELQEALYEMPHFKAWKDYSGMSEEQKATAWQKVRMELVDALHFFVNLLLCAGFSAEEVYSMYVAKNKENHRRQDAGYTADVSYKNQSVEEVMHEVGCKVSLNGQTKNSSNFVAILDGSDVFYNTDLIALGVAANALNDVFNKKLAEAPTEVRKVATRALSGGFKE